MYLCTNEDGCSWLFYGVKPNWSGSKFIQYGGEHFANPYTGPNKPQPGQCVECELIPTPSLGEGVQSAPIDPTVIKETIQFTIHFDIETNDLSLNDQIKTLQGIIDNKQESIHELEQRVSDLESERNKLNATLQLVTKDRDALQAKLREIPNPVAELVDAIELGSLSPGRRLSLIQEIRNHYGQSQFFEAGYEYKVEGEDHWWKVIHIYPDSHFMAVHIATKNSTLFDEKGNCTTPKNGPWKLSYTRRKSDA